jgi:hypothetical protein
MQLIGLTGYARSGKDTVAEMIISDVVRASGGRAPHVPRLSFAAPIKRFCREVFGWSLEHTDGMSKEVPLKDWVRPDGTPLTPRFAMQTLGTEWGRNCDPDIWIKSLLVQVAKEIQAGTKLCIVTDVRFVNEAAALREIGGEIWRVARAVPVSAHPSEAEIWSTAMHQFVTVDIDNRGYLTDTHAQVVTALWKTGVES